METKIMMNRRTTLVALGASVLARVARAQSYPTRPIKLVVPTSAGGIADFIGRGAGEIMARSLGQPLVL
jgi:tripartite-type tricarboxylate transporter receptor subunit TctC